MKTGYFVEVERITGDRQEAVFHEGFMWDSDFLTRRAYQRAKERYAVSFEQAAYLIDLYEDDHEMVDTFPISESGYKTLKAVA